MSERFSRQSSAGISGGLSGRGTAPPKRAPTPQRRHTLSTLGEIPPLPPRRVGTGRRSDSDSDSDDDHNIPRRRPAGTPASAAASALTGSLPASRTSTPIRCTSPVRYLDGSSKPLIIKTMPFGRTNSQPAYSDAPRSAAHEDRGDAPLDTTDTFAGTYSSGTPLANAHPPLVPHSPPPSGLMPPLAPTNHMPVLREKPPREHDPVLSPKRSQSAQRLREAPLYPTENLPSGAEPVGVFMASPVDTTEASATAHQQATSPTRHIRSKTPAEPPTRPSSGTGSTETKALAATPAATPSSLASPPAPTSLTPKTEPALYANDPRRASPPLARRASPPPALRISPRCVRTAAAKEQPPAPAPPPFYTAQADTRPARAPAASATTVPRGPPPFAPRTAVDDVWSGFSPRPELPGRQRQQQQPTYGSAGGAPREKPVNGPRHAPQSSRRPTQSVQTARERAAQRRRAASSSPTTHRMAGSSPSPREREANMFPGAKRVEANDRVSVKHAVLLAAGAVTAVVTAVVLVRALTRSSAAPTIAVPVARDVPVPVGGGDGGGGVPVVKGPRRGTPPVLLAPPVGARPEVNAGHANVEVTLSATGENPHTMIADIRDRVIGALTG